MQNERKKDGRLHLRLPEELKVEIRQYALMKNTTVSSLVTRYFTRLLEEEKRRQHPVDAEQV